MKAYTDIEQSKKLAEILPLESADMCYRIVAYNPNNTHEYQPYCFSGTLESDIPCWSLAALLAVLSFPALRYDIEDGEGRWIVGCDVGCENDDKGYLSYYKDNPVDTCYGMILKLHELNLL